MVEVALGVEEPYFAEEVNRKVPEMLQTMCVIWAGLVVIGLLLVSNYRKDDEYLRLYHERELLLPRSETMTFEDKAEQEAPIWAILLSKDSVLLFLISFCHIFYGYYIIGTFKTLGGKTISDDRFLTFVGSVGSLFNGLSRIFWSSLLDCYSFKRVFRTLSCIQLFLITTVLWSANYPYLYFVNVSLSMMCEGAMTSILPTETLQHFK